MSLHAPTALDALIPAPSISEPSTPHPANATIDENAVAASTKAQADRIEKSTIEMTPPPSSQIPSPDRIKTRTPTPSASHISTPPPTIGSIDQHGERSVPTNFLNSLNQAEIKCASIEELRSRVGDLQAALYEAKMTAAHHKLQYQMLSQESAAALERMAVEARMTQFENEVIRNAEEARSRSRSRYQIPALEEGTIAVQKELYHTMCRDIQILTGANKELEQECEQQQRILLSQDGEIASLGDKVNMLRERIRENREQLQKYRTTQGIQSVSRSAYSTPHRTQHQSTNNPRAPFAALLEASEIASRESSRTGRKGHTRSVHSLSSLPTTPHNARLLADYNSSWTDHDRMEQATPTRRPYQRVPATAPISRTSHHQANFYPAHHHAAPSHRVPMNGPAAPASEGTVSASDRDADDSEAETEIIEPEADETMRINESHASRAASQMLRSSQEQAAQRASFSGSGMLPVTSPPPAAGRSGARGLKQTRLFGAVRKAGVDRDGGEPPAKRARTTHAVGLGIAGLDERR